MRNTSGMPLKTPTLMLLSTPPPFGGGEIRSVFLQRHFSGKIGYRLFAPKRKSGSKYSQGRLSPLNIARGLHLIVVSCWLLCVHRPHKVYTLVPKEFYAFVRTAIIFLVANLTNTQVYGDLAGEDFLFLRKAGFKRRAGLFLLNRIHSLRVLGPSVERRLRQQYQYPPERITVFDNGAYVPSNLAISKETVYRDPLNLLYVGALNPMKGTMNLIKALRICKQSQINVHLDIIGEWSDDALQTEIHKEIQRYNLHRDVKFHGKVLGEGKWEIIRCCALLVHPTFWDGQPLTILEAMGCGLGIISTRVGAIPDTVRHKENGILIEKNTPETISQAVISLYYDRETLLTFSRNNRNAYHERFRVSAFCRRVEKWLDETAS